MCTRLSRSAPPAIVVGHFLIATFQLLGDHPRTESIPMIYVLATNLYTQQLILDSRTDYAKIGEVLADVKLALSHNLDLTKEQRVSLIF
jgi:hypothetical protein